MGTCEYPTLALLKVILGGAADEVCTPWVCSNLDSGVGTVVHRWILVHCSGRVRPWVYLNRINKIYSCG